MEGARCRKRRPFVDLLPGVSGVPPTPVVPGGQRHPFPEKVRQVRPKRRTCSRYRRPCGILDLPSGVIRAIAAEIVLACLRDGIRGALHRTAGRTSRDTDILLDAPRASARSSDHHFHQRKLALSRRYRRERAIVYSTAVRFATEPSFLHPLDSVTSSRLPEMRASFRFFSGKGVCRAPRRDRSTLRSLPLGKR